MCANIYLDLILFTYMWTQMCPFVSYFRRDSLDKHTALVCYF